jgi:hypothetical protein
MRHHSAHPSQRRRLEGSGAAAVPTAAGRAGSPGPSAGLVPLLLALLAMLLAVMGVSLVSDQQFRGFVRAGVSTRPEGPPSPTCSACSTRQSGAARSTLCPYSRCFLCHWQAQERLRACGRLGPFSL